MKNRIQRSIGERILGLTMIEMFVVMGVCGILALILIPFMLKARSNARMVVCVDNLKGLGQAYSVCLFNSSGALPDVYYTYSGSGNSYQINMRAPNTADTGMMTREVSSAMVCPNDQTPREVASQTIGGATGTTLTSYGYNVSLPVAFRNWSRIPFPVNTVTFFDGDAASVEGQWQRIPGWQGRAIRLRHMNDTANYLYLDGHVERLEAFSDESFNGTVALYSHLPSSTNPVTTTTTPVYASTTTLPPNVTTTTVPLPPPPPTTFAVGGMININPSNNSGLEFNLTLPDGFTVTRDNLHGDTVLAPHAGFYPVGLEYYGPAALVHVKPKGNGDMNGLTVNGLAYTLKNGNIYDFTSNSMTVHLFNDKRNSNGKAMGKWWVEITGSNVTIKVTKPGDDK